MRFSLRWLFGIVFYAAFGCALLVYGNDSLNAACSLAFSSLSVVSLMGAVFMRQERRVFWAGCAIVAWSFMLTDALPSNPYTPPTAIRSVLWALGRLLPPTTDDASTSTIFTTIYDNLDGTGAQVFVAIGLSVLGGPLARCIWSRSGRTQTDSKPA